MSVLPQIFSKIAFLITPRTRKVEIAVPELILEVDRKTFIEKLVIVFNKEFLKLSANTMTKNSIQDYRTRSIRIINMLVSDISRIKIYVFTTDEQYGRYFEKSTLNNPR